MTRTDTTAGPNSNKNRSRRTSATKRKSHRAARTDSQGPTSSRSPHNESAAPPNKAAAPAVASKPEPDSDFDSGIFEQERAKASSEQKTYVAKAETSHQVAQFGDSQSTAKPGAPSQQRRRRARKSRTRRLAEEAEVISAIRRTAVADDAIEPPLAPPAAATESTQLDFDELEEVEPPRTAVAPANERPKPSPVSPPAPGGPPKLVHQPAKGREMLINVSEGDECRIALLQDGRLDELYIERASATSNVGNIYKGRVTNVEPSIQAAFVDFGLPSHGFLHISDLHNQYFPRSRGEQESVGKKTPRRERPPIQQCLRRGQEILVQVIKEGIGTKGPTLTSYISIPGRFLVMMPGLDQLGVSRKIEDDEKRKKMRELLNQLSLPKGMGFIVRTAGTDRPKRDLQRDLNYLSRLWKRITLRIRKDPAPAVIYKESDLVIRSIRDLHDSSIQRIIVDSPAVAKRIREFLAIASPRSRDVVTIDEGAEPLFHRYGLEVEIDRLHAKTVPLPCGGSIVIEQTEAMVAIDVNSGRFRVPENAEETAYRVNQEAVDEIARHLRLRDLGGLIVVDLIDMIQERHRRAIEKRMADALRKHKERAKILRISKFGLLEMTRQRQRPSLSRSLFRDCPRCAGSGRVKAPESVALDAMRQIRIASHRDGVAAIEVRVSPAVASDLLNRKRHQIAELEKKASQTIRIDGDEGFSIDQISLTCHDRRGRDVQSLDQRTDPVRRFSPRDRRPR